MHEFSVATRRLLDAVTALFAALAAVFHWMAAVRLDQVATAVTIGAGLMSIICGAIRVQEFISKYRAKRAAGKAG